MYFSSTNRFAWVGLAPFYAGLHLVQTSSSQLSLWIRGFRSTPSIFKPNLAHLYSSAILIVWECVGGKRELDDGATQEVVGKR